MSVTDNHDTQKWKNQGFIFFTVTKLKEKYFFQQGQAFGLNFGDGTAYRWQSQGTVWFGTMELQRYGQMEWV